MKGHLPPEYGFSLLRLAMIVDLEQTSACQFPAKSCFSDFASQPWKEADKIRPVSDVVDQGTLSKALFQRPL